MPAENVLEHLAPIVPPDAPFPERRLGRALAFLTLYETDLARHPPSLVLERLAEATGGAQPFSPEVALGAQAYARALVKGVMQRKTEIDAIIHERAPSWPLNQMSAIDRNVLRVGLFEALFSTEGVPMKAAINEAVELAKLFGSETSGRFVNGVLGRAVE